MRAERTRRKALWNGRRFRRRFRPGRGRAEGQGRANPLFARRPLGSPSFDAAICAAHPPCAGALRSRLRPHGQRRAASAKILRLNADAASLRDLRFAARLAEACSGPAARTCVRLRRELAGRPPSSRPRPIGEAAARLDPGCAGPERASQASGKPPRNTCAGQGDPLCAAGKSAALVFSAFPDAPAADAEILALWAFDVVIAIRLRWPRPMPLIARRKFWTQRSEVRAGEGDGARDLE